MLLLLLLLLMMVFHLTCTKRREADCKRANSRCEVDRKRAHHMPRSQAVCALGALAGGHHIAYRQTLPAA